jgi:hypothetical protein
MTISERRACLLLGQPRSTQRYAGGPAENTGFLVERVQQLSKKHPRFGYRRLWLLLKAEGIHVSCKSVYRISKLRRVKSKFA